MINWIRLTILTSQFLCAQTINFNNVSLHIKAPKNSQITIDSSQIISCQNFNLCLQSPVILYEEANSSWRIEADGGEINPESAVFKATDVKITTPSWWTASANLIEFDPEKQYLSLSEPAMKIKNFIIKSPKATALIKSQNLIINGPWEITLDKS
jgi:hypothetical protein